MKKIPFVMIAIVCLSAFYNADEKIFPKLYVLEGTWRMATKQGAICEEWTKINENYLQNKGFVIKGKDTIVSERVALKNTSEGIFYTSTVEDQNSNKPISFKLTKAENNLFVFENKLHDFPKRIVYELINADSLQAFVDDGIDGLVNRQKFYYKKVK